MSAKLSPNHNIMTVLALPEVDLTKNHLATLGRPVIRLTHLPCPTDVPSQQPAGLSASNSLVTAPSGPDSPGPDSPGPPLPGAPSRLPDWMPRGKLIFIQINSYHFYGACLSFKITSVSYRVPSTSRALKSVPGDVQEEEATGREKPGRGVPCGGQGVGCWYLFSLHELLPQSLTLRRSVDPLLLPSSHLLAGPQHVRHSPSEAG